LEGLLAMAELIERHAERRLRARRFRIDRHGALELREALLALAAREQREPESDVTGDGVGLELERALEQRLGALGILPQVHVAEPLARRGRLRVQEVGVCVLPERRGRAPGREIGVAAREALLHRVRVLRAVPLPRRLRDLLLGRAVALLLFEPAQLGAHRVRLTETEIRAEARAAEGMQRQERCES